LSAKDAKEREEEEGMNRLFSFAPLRVLRVLRGRNLLLGV
jgi:hypothetical protein